MQYYDENGNPVEDPTPAFLARLEALESSNRGLTEANRTLSGHVAAMRGQPSPEAKRPAEVGYELYEAEKAKGTPDDYAQATFVRGVAEETLRQRAAPQASGETIEERLARVEAENRALKGEE